MESQAGSSQHWLLIWRSADGGIDQLYYRRRARAERLEAMRELASRIVRLARRFSSRPDVGLFGVSDGDRPAQIDARARGSAGGFYDRLSFSPTRCN